jgi:MraZ protein
VLRGNHSAKIDDKGRLKVPAEFRGLIEEKHGPRVFVTSLDGQFIRIYPMPVWETIEARLAAMPSTDARKRFLHVVNYYGQSGELDTQGRVLVHPRLREAAQIVGEVDVLGMISYLDVWNHDRLAARLAERPLTEQDFDSLSDAGI